MSLENNIINYIEFKSNDLEKIKTFYNSTFGWEFKDYGKSYVSFLGKGIRGGFEKTDDKITNGVLVVLYHSDIEAIQNKVKENGGVISKEIFDFPGGRRFHFVDPSGNELGVWSEK